MVKESQFKTESGLQCVKIMPWLIKYFFFMQLCSAVEEQNFPDFTS